MAGGDRRSAAHQGSTVQRTFFKQPSAQNTLDGGPAKHARFLDGFVIRARNVLDHGGRGSCCPRGNLLAPGDCLRAVGQPLVKALFAADVSGRFRSWLRRNRGPRGRLGFSLGGRGCLRGCLLRGDLLRSGWLSGGLLGSGLLVRKLRGGGLVGRGSRAVACRLGCGSGFRWCRGRGTYRRGASNVAGNPHHPRTRRLLHGTGPRIVRSVVLCSCVRASCV